MENAETSRRLSGFVQIDDAYLGGELTGGTSGRGLENKVPFDIAVSTTEDDKPLLVVASKLSSFTNQAIRDWAADRLEPGCDVCSADLKCFAVPSEFGHAHTLHIAKRREAARAPAMRWVNTVLSNIKRSVDGSYHSLRFEKYGQRYLSEAVWRFKGRQRHTFLVLQPILRAHGADATLRGSLEHRPLRSQILRLMRNGTSQERTSPPNWLHHPPQLEDCVIQRNLPPLAPNAGSQ